MSLNNLQTSDKSNFNNFTRLPYDSCYARNQFPTLDEIRQMKRQKVEVFNGVNAALTSNERVIASALTNTRERHQLWTRPYLGSYRGAGMNSVEDDNVALESILLQGSATKLRNKTNEPIQGAPLGRFECLPEFGNPQRSQYIIPPQICEGGWIRGGADTRDYVRRVDYFRRCAHGNKY
jgi:hypothetical protein